MMGKAIKKKNNKNPVTLIVLPEEVTLVPVIPPEEMDPSDDEEEDEEADDDDGEPAETIGKEIWGIGLGGCGSPIGGVGLLDELSDGWNSIDDDDSVIRLVSISLVVVGVSVEEFGVVRSAVAVETWLQGWLSVDEDEGETVEVDDIRTPAIALPVDAIVVVVVGSW